MTNTVLKATTQKSYYKKAHILTDDNGNKFLQSYNTVVCGIVNDVFFRYWNDYSATTQNHINDFRKQNNLPSIGKKEWCLMDVHNNPIPASEKAHNVNMGSQNIYFNKFLF